MRVLDEIILNKIKEVKNNKEISPVERLEKSSHFIAEKISLKEHLLTPGRMGLIAEIKRKSPSRGVLNEKVDVEKLSAGYLKAGASALSILTDSLYFDGGNDDIINARKFNACPILRKDFIIDEYQIIEAKAIGANAILLIARVLEPQLSAKFAKFAHSIGLEVLLEVHSASELQSHLNPDIDVVGVNNRDLDTLQMNVDLSFRLADMIPSEFCKISESGISSAKVMKDLKSAGYDGFLVGETFMKTQDPAEACAKLLKELQALS